MYSEENHMFQSIQSNQLGHQHVSNIRNKKRMVQMALLKRAHLQVVDHQKLARLLLHHPRVSHESTWGFDSIRRNWILRILELLFPLLHDLHGHQYPNRVHQLHRRRLQLRLLLDQHHRPQKRKERIRDGHLNNNGMVQKRHIQHGNHGIRRYSNLIFFSYHF